MKDKKYWEKYRGFEVVGESVDSVLRFNEKSRTLETVKGISYDLFDIDDQTHVAKLATYKLGYGHEISEGVEGEFNRAVKSFIDDHFFELCTLKTAKAKERKILQLSNAVKWISENEEGETLYQVLSKELGLSDYDIVKVGHTELFPYFDLEKYAEVIADAIVQEGIVCTSCGNWIIPFTEIKEEFAVDLSSNKDLLGYIKEALYSIYGEVIAEMDIYEDSFDITYFLAYCPNLEED